MKGLALAAALAGAVSAVDLPGPLDGRLVADVDGDGHADVLAICGRVAYLYRATAEGGLLAVPELLSFPADAVAVDAADLDGDGAAELVVMKAGAIHAARYGAAGLTLDAAPLAEAGLGFEAVDPAQVASRRFAGDWDGDGRVELLVPRPRQLVLLARDTAGDGFSERAVLEVDPVAHIDLGSGDLDTHLVSSWWLPRPHSGDIDGDGRSDLILQHQKRLLVHRQEEGGRFAARPGYGIDLDFLVEPDRPRGRRGRALDFDFPVQLVDVNGDGVLDVVAASAGQGWTRFYLGSAERRVCDAPDVELRVEGYIFPKGLQDLNGDGRPDVSLVAMERIGMLGALKIFITGRLDLRLLTWFNRGGGDGPLFPREPDEASALQLRIQLSGGAGGLRIGGQLVVADGGDLDGDGRRDRAQVEDGDRLVVRLRGADGRLPARPSFSLEVPDTAPWDIVESEVADLDADGTDDLLLFYRGRDDQPGRVVAVRIGERP